MTASLTVWPDSKLLIINQMLAIFGNSNINVNKFENVNRNVNKSEIVNRNVNKFENVNRNVNKLEIVNNQTKIPFV